MKPKVPSIGGGKGGNWVAGATTGPNGSILCSLKVKRIFGLSASLIEL